MTGFVCILLLKIYYYQNAKTPTSGDLKSGDFFSDQHSPPPTPTEFADTTPTPSLTEQFRGKTLSIRDFKWLNTHPIRLPLI